MTEKSNKPQAPHGKRHSDEVTLTPADETALDKAWTTITPDDIQRSIERLRQIQRQGPTPHPDR